MNEKKIHIGRIILVISIIIFIVLAIIIFHQIKKLKNTPYYKEETHLFNPTYIKYSSSDNAFSIRVNGNYAIYPSNNENYVLNLYTNDGFSMSVTSVKKYNFDLLKIAESDRISFLNKFENYSNLTKIKEITYNNLSGYYYCLHFTKNNKEFILTEFITEINGVLYFFDIQHPIEHSKTYEKLKNDLLNCISF